MFPWQPVAWVLAGALVAMTATWWLQRRTRNAGYVDVVWAALMGAAALFYGAVGGGAATPRLLVAMLGGIWGFRLSLHLLARVLHESEDGRYRHLREHWRDDQAKFLAFFLGQTGLTALFSLPFLVVANNPVTGFTWWSLAGIALWAFALGGESLADAQLAHWRKQSAHRGRTCRAGLWRYSRHPNYFFEWLHWFAYVLLAVGSPWWAWSLVGPLLMGASLLWVTGIPFTEAQSLRSRGEDYRAYQREVSMFFPWFPKAGNREWGMGNGGSNRRGRAQPAPEKGRFPIPHSPFPTPAPMLIDLCERGLVPDALTRYGIRRLCARRLHEEHGNDAIAAWEQFRRRLDDLRQSPVAIETDAANRQHYEVPARFFELCLGRRLKYSSCYYPRGDESLDQAEEAMLALYGERAELADGQCILELGCGWGSMTLWMAERYRNARITGVSNSHGQREHILAQARARGLENVEILTCDVNRLELERRFDRVVSIEMFEHMRNYDRLLRNIAGWMEADARLFVHIFCHRELMYPFETEGDDNWMGRHFFTGGLMPAADTLLHFQDDLVLQQQWRLSGTHYERTANHWLANQDANREEVLRVLASTYGVQAAGRWHQRWRMFWMACAELFGYAGGGEWLVGHYRFAKR